MRKRRPPLKSRLVAIGSLLLEGASLISLTVWLVLAVEKDPSILGDYLIIDFHPPKTGSSSH